MAVERRSLFCSLSCSEVVVAERTGSEVVVINLHNKLARRAVANHRNHLLLDARCILPDFACSIKSHVDLSRSKLNRTSFANVVMDIGDWGLQGWVRLWRPRRRLTRRRIANVHRTLPPNFPGDIQGIQQIYHEYITNIPGREYTPNIPQSIQAEDDSSTSMVT